MFDIYCVTERSLCSEELSERVKKLAEAGPKGIILRDKTLPERDYIDLARKCTDICESRGVECILHGHLNAAKVLGNKALHLPLPALRGLSETDKGRFRLLGASCHSESEAIEAERLGCTYIIAGHVFDTDCKKGFPGRGLSFLKTVCKCVSIPVFAIGGVSEANIAELQGCGAAGACVMSAAMTCKDADAYLKGLNLCLNASSDCR